MADDIVVIQVARGPFVHRLLPRLALLERETQPGRTPRDTIGHCFRRDTQSSGDVAVGHALDVPELERLAPAPWKTDERQRQPLKIFQPKEAVQWIAVRLERARELTSQRGGQEVSQIPDRN